LNLECIACTPADREVILVDGTYEICPENIYVGPYLHEYISDLSFAGEYLDTDGTCEICDIYTHPTLDGLNCTTDICNLERDIINTVGNCETCEDF
jgi:hypothetical protein